MVGKVAPIKIVFFNIKLKLKKLTQRKWSIDLTRRIEQLNLSIRGWINYLSLGNMKNIVTSIDEQL